MFTWYKRLAQTRPYWFVAVTVLLFFLSGSIGVLIAILFTDEAFNASVPQTAGKVTGWFFCLLVLWRWRALAGAGVAGSGSRRLTLLTLILAIYLVAAMTWSFFGKVLVTVPETTAAREMLLQQLGTALLEEFTFRGVMFYGLLLAWGRRRSGVLRAALVSALAFGSLHLVYLASGDTLAVVLNALISVLEGFWYAIMVWRYKSLWPPVLFHFLTNTLVLANTPVTTTLPSAYPMALLAQLPMLVITLYWLKNASSDKAKVQLAS